MLGHKAAFIARAAFHQGLRIVFERVRQRISAHIADRKLLSFALQHKINAPAIAADASWLDCTAHANPVRAPRAVQRLQFGDGVVVGLALAITQPRQRSKRNNDYCNPDSKLC